MPYKIEEREGKYCVVKETDGSTVHCHETRAQAEAQMRALYVHENADENLTRFVPFVKIDNDRRMVWGVATDESVDLENDVVDYEATKAAVAEWARWRNVREMHGPNAVGVAEKIVLDDASRSLRIGVRVVDDAAWAKVKTGVYKGFSIGGKIIQTVHDGANGVRRILKYLLTEISLVDRPANPQAVFTLVKRKEVVTMGKLWERHQAILTKRQDKLVRMRKNLKEVEAKLEEARNAAEAVEEDAASLEETVQAVSTAERAVHMADMAATATQEVMAALADESVGMAEEQARLNVTREALQTAQEAIDEAALVVGAAVEADGEAETESPAVTAAEEAVNTAMEVVDAAEEALNDAESQIAAEIEAANGGAEENEMTREKVRQIVMSVLEELGLIGNELALSTQVKSLRKVVTGLRRREVQKVAGDLQKVLGDLAKVAGAVDDLEERMNLLEKMSGRMGPVLREISPWNMGHHSEAVLKSVLAETNDPRVREAIGQRLAEMEIKAAPRQVMGPPR